MRFLSISRARRGVRRGAHAASDLPHYIVEERPTCLGVIVSIAESSSLPGRALRRPSPSAFFSTLRVPATLLFGSMRRATVATRRDRVCGDKWKETPPTYPAANAERRRTHLGVQGLNVNGRLVRHHARRSKHVGSTLLQRSLPFRDLVRMHIELLLRFRQRALAFYCRQRHFCLNAAECVRRVLFVMSSVPLSPLSWLRPRLLH